nr:hypothetical protein [Tanacetum cinerariifolium]
MGRDKIQLENAVSTISQKYLLEFTPEYRIPKSLHPELPGPEDPIVKFLEGKVGVTPNMDLFSLISAPNPAKVKTETRPRAAHEVPLLTATANRVIDIEDMTGASGSLGTPSTVDKSPLDFSNEDPLSLITERTRMEEQKETVAMGALVNKRCRKRGPDEAEANAPPKVLRKDHVPSHPSQGTLRGKSLAAMGIGTGSTVSTPATQETPGHARGVNDSDPLSLRKAVITEDPDSEKFASFTSMVGSPGSIYHPGWGVTNNCRLDTSTACQDMVDHIVPPGYFLKMRHLPNDEFLNQYNTTLTQQVGMGSQLRLWFEHEAKLLKKAVAQIARRDQRIQAKEKHIKNLEALLEAEANMKDTTEAKNVELVKELESLRAQVTGEERIKAAFEEFKKYEDDRVNSRCAKIDTGLDALSIDFDEELYPHMLTAIAGRRWVIRHSLRLAIMKCTEYIELRQVFVDVVYAGIAKGMSEGLNHRVEHEKAKVDLAAIEAYDPEADAKYVAALHELKDLKYTHQSKASFPKQHTPRSLTEDYMLAKEITRVSGEVNNVVIARAQFLDELDSLGTRHVPAKMAEFFHEIQMKHCEIVDKLQILVREMELNACKKNYSLRSLIVSFCIEDVGEVAFVK